MNHVLCDIILKASPDSVSQLRHQVTSESYSFKIFPDETGPNSCRFIKPLNFPLMSPERLRRDRLAQKSESVQEGIAQMPFLINKMAKQTKT